MGGVELHYLTIIPSDHIKPIFIAKPLSNARLNFFYYLLWECGLVKVISRQSHGLCLYSEVDVDAYETDAGKKFSRVVTAAAALALPSSPPGIKAF